MDIVRIMEGELLPCPFCGGAVEFHGRDKRGWSIECFKCHLKMNIISAPSRVIKAWNTRYDIERSERLTHISTIKRND